MRVWIDLTAPAHPVVLRPIIERLRKRGDDVFVTARDYAQTLELTTSLGINHIRLGRHGGASRVRKLAHLMQRTTGMYRHGRRYRGKSGIDLAIGHGSNDLAIAAKLLNIPAVNMFDYEWAKIQHKIGCNLARRVLTPDTIPPDRLVQYGAGPEKLVQYPGLKEEYYLADFEADDTVFKKLGVDRERVVVIVRPPPDVSLYHRHSNQLFPQILETLGRDKNIHAVVIPRTQEQRAAFIGLDCPSLIIPAQAVDTQSLIALADLVISAGGTMNREAVALGTPAYTTFQGRMGGVDEALIRENRLHPLTDMSEIKIEKSDGSRKVLRRDPQLLMDLALAESLS